MTEITSARTAVGELGAYLALPAEDKPTGGMLLLPMVTGIGAQVREYADGIAATGVAALAWDPWHGPSSDDTPVEELRALMGKLDDDEVRAEETQLLDYMYGELGLSKVGVIGWCLGGRFALILAARDGRLANCVAYHPTVRPEPLPNQSEDAVALTAQITAPVKLIYPGADHLVPRGVFDDLQAALQSRPSAATSICLYPEAGHGFMEAGRREQEENREATRQSWAETLAFVQATVG